MALKFGVVCDLLSTLEDVVTHDPPHLPADRRQKLSYETRAWFRAHRRTIDKLDESNTVALLSTLLPERRTDRVYGLQNATLSMLLSRTLAFSVSKIRDLNAYKQPGNGDLASCLERVLQGGGPPALPIVTILEIDQVLTSVAAESRFSSPTLKRKFGQPCPVQQSHSTALANIFRRLHPQEAKWLARLVLKDFSPVCLDDNLVLRLLHFLLPDILHFQHDFDVAVNTLRTSLKAYPSCPDPQSEPLLRKLVSSALRPVLGIKVARPNFAKARSIQNCLDMLQRRRWMVERKYDGEYCEMHIDLIRGQDWLKIFSKSGKDSTQDRAALRPILERCLGIGKPHCKIKTKCILLGEMVVWSDQDHSVMPFHKIRKYVTRSGVELGTSHDSPRHNYEHLMIVFFDLLVLDDVMVLNKSVEERKAMLNGLYRKKVGRAITAESKVMDFAQPESKRRLIAHLASSIAARHEGLVLKPCGQPYFSMTKQDGPACIKLKKDYIKGLGDEADFAIIGASYSAQDALRRGSKSTHYTRFHLGCLMNKDEVKRFGARAIFKLVGSIGNDQCIPPPVLERANARLRFCNEPFVPGTMLSAFDLAASNLPVSMNVALREPFVFEVLGSSYDKASNTDFWMLRHARVLKMHEDRSWKDCVSFQELQALAVSAVEHVPEAESQENLHWMTRVEQSCRRKIARHRASISPKSATTDETRATVSPDKGRALQDLSHNIRQTPSRRSTLSDSMTSPKQSSRVSHEKQRRDDRSATSVRDVALESASLPTPPPSSPPPEKLNNSPMSHLTLSSSKLCPVQEVRQMDNDKTYGIAPLPTSKVSKDVVAIFPTSPAIDQRVGTTTIAETGCDGVAENYTRDDTCLLSDFVIYLPPSLVHLGAELSKHRAIVIYDLVHWNRRYGDFPPLSEIVGESQSYHGFRKVIVVSEKASMREMMNVLADVGRLNEGRGLREHIEIWSDAVMNNEACMDARHAKMTWQLGSLDWHDKLGKSVLRLHDRS